jgi:hypothetical protein
MESRPLPSATWRAPVAQDVAEHKAKLVIAFIPEQSQQHTALVKTMQPKCRKPPGARVLVTP